MRVCIDFQSAIGRRAGVGRYTHSLAAHLPAHQLPGDELSLFFFDFRGRGAPDFPAGIRMRRNRWVPGRLAQQAWKRLHFPPFNWMSGPAEVYHFPNFIIPPLSRGRAVVTIHDVSFLRFPHTTEARNLRYLGARIRDTVRRADLILTDSQAMADDIHDCLGVPSGRLRSIPLGISPDFRRPSDPDRISVLRRHRLERPYLLFVGTLEPRKNIPFLVEVFERLSDFDGDLVLVGATGWKAEPILSRLHHSRCAGRIRRIPEAGDADLPALYAGAECLVFPSLYEGFGFPPLEAMACGTPVISSRGGSLAEILDGAADLLSAFDADQWAGAIGRMRSDTARRADFVRRGLARARQFDWNETARRTWQAYRELA